MNFRVPPRTESLLQRLESISDGYAACLLVIDLFENHYRFECKEPDQFDSNTGKPIHYRWRPGVEFEHGGRFKDIYLGGSNCVAPGKDHIRLHPDVESLLIANPTLIECNTGIYAFIYSEHENSGQEQGGGTYYSKRRQINIYKLNFLKKEKGGK